MTLKDKVNLLAQLANLKEAERQGITLEDIRRIEKEISTAIDILEAYQDLFTPNIMEETEKKLNACR